MKVVILAGGLGTRLSEYTHRIPKPLVEIGNIPIIVHLIKRYRMYDHKNFVIALGYKGNLIKQYFYEHSSVYKDGKEIKLNSKTLELYIPFIDVNVTLVETGQNSMTGGRLKQLADLIDNERFMLTYGDGLSNINIDQLVESHLSSKKLVTVSAVHPIARFGELSINCDGDVTSFQEKPQVTEGWINGGFFVMEPNFLKYIKNDTTILEKAPLERVANELELNAYKHDGFWQCMDTQRDKETFEEMIKLGNPPWEN